MTFSPMLTCGTQAFSVSGALTDSNPVAISRRVIAHPVIESAAKDTSFVLTAVCPRFGEQTYPNRLTVGQ